MGFKKIARLLVLLTFVAAACSTAIEQNASTGQAAVTDPDFVEIESPAEVAPEESEIPDQLPLVDELTSEDPEIMVGEQEPPEGIDAPSSSDVPVTSTNEPVEATTTTAATVQCTAPAGFERFVVVDLDDPDGGLNVRTGPGVNNSVVRALPRGSFIRATGDCVTTGGIDWWEVSGPQTTAIAGWVSSEFLSGAQLARAPISSGTVVPDLDDLARQVVDDYGFAGNLVLRPVDGPVGLDAIGGEVTYEVSGLFADVIEGVFIQMNFSFAGPDSGQIEGFSLLSADVYPICFTAIDSEECR